MSALWAWLSVRHLLNQGGRSLLVLLSVALGVAVFVSIRLVNTTAMGAFSDTVNSVAGKANLQVVGDSDGFDERSFSIIVETPGVVAATPVVQTYALAAPGRVAARHALKKGEDDAPGDSVLVLGVEPLSGRPFEVFSVPTERDRLSGLMFLADPRGVAVTRTLAKRHGLSEGSVLTLIAAGRPEAMTVRYIIDSEQLQHALGGNVIVVDIATAQELFERYGKLDRIDLIIHPGREKAVREALAGQLPANLRLTRPQGRTQQVENMVEAFSLNLTALSFIALFVSMFLIFNAVSISVLQRRREIGILRGMGLPARSVLLLFLGEAVTLGIVGGLGGLLLGTVLARLTLASIARTLTALYLVVRAEQLVLSPGVYVSGFVLGITAAVTAALAPALEAARTPPGLTTRQGALIEAQPLPIGRWTAWGGAFLAMAVLVAAWTVGFRRPLGGFASAGLVLLGFSCLAPGFTLLAERLASPMAGRLAGIAGTLAARYLRDAIARTSAVVAALMVAVGMLVGLSVMVGSFRQTVSVWVNQTLKGDLYVEPVGRNLTGSATVLSPQVIRAARELEGVAAVDTFRAVELTFQGRLTNVVAIDLELQRRFGRLAFLGGGREDRIGRALAEGGVLITESFGHRFRVREGDLLPLPTPTGLHRLRVAGVFYDYSTDGGYLMLDVRRFRELWSQDRTESLAMYLRPGQSVDDARSRFIRAVGPRTLLYVTPNQALRARVLRIFDQTFQITYALQAIAILVAVMGVVSTLTALILQRSREIGILRAVGALRRQVQRMVWMESALLGLIGSLLGCACGLALALLLVYVINKQFFGWSIRLVLDPWLLVQTTAMIVGAALVAGTWPARIAASRLAAEAMRGE